MTDEKLSKDYPYRKKKFYIHDMDITFNEELTQEEMEIRLFSALRGAGVIGHRGCPH